MVGAIEVRDPTPVLLDGVTGGGKTAIYVEAMAASLAVGRPCLLLVPEIALATPVTDRHRTELPVRVAVLHSGLGDGERADEWRRIRAGDVDVVVGTRTALLAPLADVGLIVVDEEHDAAYKSDRTPRFQARDTAVELGRLAGAAVVLGSATPAVESMGHARAGRYRRAALPVRRLWCGTPRAGRGHAGRAGIGQPERAPVALADALAALDTAAGDRAILVLNRRGTASVVVCRDSAPSRAARIATAPSSTTRPGSRCVATTAAGPPHRHALPCLCLTKDQVPGRRDGARGNGRSANASPGCGWDGSTGTWWNARVRRERVLDDFAGGRLDVLVGTSLSPRASTSPRSRSSASYRPTSRSTSPMSARPSGRTSCSPRRSAGRGVATAQGTRSSRRIGPSTAPTARSWRRDAAAFYDEELALRERFGSPPYGRLVKLTVGLADRAAAEKEAHAMAGRLRDRAAERGLPVQVIGPAPAYIARRADRWRFNVVLRGADPVALLEPPPGAPWSVDVDPESLL